jgi:hypothetical protein
MIKEYWKEDEVDNLHQRGICCQDRKCLTRNGSPTKTLVSRQSAASPRPVPALAPKPTMHHQKLEIRDVIFANLWLSISAIRAPEVNFSQSRHLQAR